MALHAVQLVGQMRVLLAVIVKEGRPLLRKLLSAFADAIAESLSDSIGNEELRVFRPSVKALGQPNFLFAERLAVRFFRVLAVRSAIANVTVDDDQRGTVLHVERMLV